MSVQTTKRPETRRGVGLWIMNRWINPVIQAILRSRLHGLLSGSLVLLSYEGHRTGHEHALPVQYAREGKSLYISVGDAVHKTWWRSMRGGCGVRLWLAGHKVLGRADVLTDGEAAAHALGVYLCRFPQMSRTWSIRRRPNGAFVMDDVRRAAGGLVLVRINLDVLPK